MLIWALVVVVVVALVWSWSACRGAILADRRRQRWGRLYLIDERTRGRWRRVR